jgi:hypothetical protein
MTSTFVFIGWKNFCDRLDKPKNIGLNGSVGIVTGRRGIVVFFFKMSRPTLGPTQYIVRSIFGGVKLRFIIII